MGLPSLEARFEEVRRSVICAPRDLALLAQEIVAMRDKLRAGRPVPAGRFDVKHSPGGMVDAEIIWPRSWIQRNGICAGRLLPLNLPELDVSGLAMVTSIDDCPPIADGEGSVVTARFV
jgi:hypothetical protein